MVRIIPRICITAFSMGAFDFLSPFTASSVVTFCFAHFSYTISERNDCQFCVALHRYFTITKQVNEFRHSFNCPRFFDSIFSDVLMSVFIHRDAGYCFF